MIASSTSLSTLLYCYNSTLIQGFDVEDQSSGLNDHSFHTCVASLCCKIKDLKENIAHIMLLLHGGVLTHLNSVLKHNLAWVYCLMSCIPHVVQYSSTYNVYEKSTLLAV